MNTKTGSGLTPDDTYEIIRDARLYREKWRRRIGRVEKVAFSALAVVATGLGMLRDRLSGR